MSDIARDVEISFDHDSQPTRPPLKRLQRINTNTARMFVDDEADHSSDSNDTDVDDQPNTDDEKFIDNRRYTPDITMYRTLSTQETLPPSPQLRRTDTDQRDFLMHAKSVSRSPTVRGVVSSVNNCSSSSTAPTTTTTTTTNVTSSQGPSDVPNLDGEELTSLRSDDLLFRRDEPRTLQQTDSDEMHGAATPKHNGRFCLRHKRIGLTYPQCEVDPQSCVDHLRTLLANYEPDLIIVAQEKHKNEGLHLHAYVRLAKQLDTRDQRFFDIQTYHPNIKTINNELAWERYVCKCNNFRCFPAWYQPELIKLAAAKDSKKSSKSDLIAQAIYRDKQSIDEVRKNYTGFFVLHEKQVRAFYDAVIEERRNKLQRLKYLTITKFVGDGALNNQRIAGWLNDHILHPHTFRSLNLWVWGATKIGKSSLVQNLIDVGVNCYVVDYSTHFYNGISDATQLLVFDEYKGQRSITEMNKLADGSFCRLDTKGGSFQITRSLPVIVLSNFSINDAYHQVAQTDDKWLDTMRGRFIEINAVDHIVVVAERIEIELGSQ